MTQYVEPFTRQVESQTTGTAGSVLKSWTSGATYYGYVHPNTATFELNQTGEKMVLRAVIHINQHPTLNINDRLLQNSSNDTWLVEGIYLTWEPFELVVQAECLGKVSS